MKPDGIFKSLVAEPLGQAAIRSNIEEAQRGMVSTIDTIDLHGDEEIDIRGWIRTFGDSGEPIYVRIYTSFRHEDRGYGSCDVAQPARAALPQLGRQRTRRPDRCSSSLLPGADPRPGHSPASSRPTTASIWPASGS
jgi:hypothetical protein